VGLTPKEIGVLQIKSPYLLDLDTEAYSKLFRHMNFLKFTRKDIKSLVFLFL
jgi:hypothetical protein